MVIFKYKINFIFNELKVSIALLKATIPGRYMIKYKYVKLKYKFPLHAFIRE